MDNKNSNRISGKISFDDYKVKELEYRFNPKFNLDEPIMISFELGHGYEVHNGGMNVQMGVKIFDKAEEHGYPFELKIELEGLFSFEGDVDGERFLPNALAILYPYLRSIVTGYTSLANLQPLILPTINMQQYLEESKTTNKKPSNLN